MARKRKDEEPAEPFDDGFDETTFMAPAVIPPPGPVDRVSHPRGGRPKDVLKELRDKVAAGSEYYLANADQLLVYVAAHEVPIECNEDCPYVGVCHLQESSRPRSMPGGHPEYGMRCAIESAMIYTLFYGYCAELNIALANPTELQSACELATLQVWKRRVNLQIIEESNGTMMIDQVQVVKGEIQHKREAHPLFAQMQYFNTRESQILKQFHSTREQMKKAEIAMKGKDRMTSAEWLSSLPDDDEDVIDAECTEHK